MRKHQNKTSLLREYRFEGLIVLGGLLVVHAIFISQAFRQSTTVDPEAASQFGAFVGGYIGALFSLVAIVLLFATLRAQREASQSQSFESKYFVMIKLHRANVSELELGNSTGRKVFVLMLRELRCAHKLVREVAESTNQSLTKAQLLEVAYLCLFFGVGPNSSRALKMYLSRFEPAFVDAVENKLNNDGTKREVQRERGFRYLPFEGHQSRLGHYYRHLYQMVRYVDQQASGIDRYEFVKTIRAQLSTHEQAMLLANSLTELGRNWWKKHLILDYKFVKNIPRDFFEPNTELNTEQMFPRKYFEWEESVEHRQTADRGTTESA